MEVFNILKKVGCFAQQLLYSPTYATRWQQSDTTMKTDLIKSRGKRWQVSG